MGKSILICYTFLLYFLLQGAPHYHFILWIENMPVVGIDGPEEVSSFIQDRKETVLLSPAIETNGEMEWAWSRSNSNRERVFTYFFREQA